MLATHCKHFKNCKFIDPNDVLFDNYYGRNINCKLTYKINIIIDTIYYYNKYLPINKDGMKRTNHITSSSLKIDNKTVQKMITDYFKSDTERNIKFFR